MVHVGVTDRGENVSQLRFNPDSIYWSDYPAWIRDLIPSQDLTVALFVVRDLDPVQALQLVGAGTHPIQPVQLPVERPADPYSSRAHVAVGADPQDYALLATRVGDWTVVLDTSGMTFGDEAIALSRKGHEAAACAVNLTLETHLTYAVSGDRRFSLADPVSVLKIEDLPPALRSAAEASGAYAPEAQRSVRGATENFSLICALAGLELTLEDLRRLPLFGTKLDGTN